MYVGRKYMYGGVHCMCVLYVWGSMCVLYVWGSMCELYVWGYMYMYVCAIHGVVCLSSRE